MILATLNQAQRLEAPRTLEEITDYAADSARTYQDHQGIVLGDTRMTPDGHWRYNGAEGPLSRHALGQLCSRLPLPGGGTIPASYLARCPSELAAGNLNHWLEEFDDRDNQVFVRTTTRNSCPRVRAILSKRYAPVNHLDLLGMLAPVAQRHGLQVNSWAIDDEHMTLRLTVGVDHPASLDDPLRVGVQIGNSEVGKGYVTVHAFITRLVCSNGLTVTVRELGAIRRRHIGAAGESLRQQIEAGLGGVLNGADEACRRFIRLRQQPVPEAIEPFIDRTVTRLDLPEQTGQLARAYLTGETMYDVVNALTRAAQDFPLTERVRIEQAAGVLL